jgi:short-subunit dehydrogenase
MDAKTWFLTGASAGIGYELTKLLLTRRQWSPPPPAGCDH